MRPAARMSRTSSAGIEMDGAIRGGECDVEYGEYDADMTPDIGDTAIV